MIILQEHHFAGNENVESFSIDFTIKGDLLNPMEITNNLLIQPTRAWKKGEKYKGKTKNTKTNIIEECWRERPWSIWGFDTKEKIKTKIFSEHIDLFLSIFWPKKSYLERYLNENENYSICISFCLGVIDEAGGYEIEADKMKKLSELSHYIDFRFIANL